MRTKSIELVPHTPEHLRALFLQGFAEYEKSFGIPPAEGLRAFIGSGEMSSDWLTRLKSATVADPWQHGFAMVHVADQMMIGLASFKAPPNADRVVEIAYGVAPEYQGKGYATEAAQALTDYAFTTGKVRTVCAHTLPEPNASTKVLAKCGFKNLGEVMDPEDGRVWRWERELPKDHVSKKI